MKDDTQPQQSNDATPALSMSDLLGLSMQLNGRIDTLWQRVIYAHGLMIGVLVFFAQTEHPFAIPRLLVLFFYSMNSLVTFIAFQDAFRGLRAVLQDLQAQHTDGSHVQAWAASQDYTTHALRRALILGALWMVIAYLLIYPLVLAEPIF